MKLILRETVAELGQAGEVINVKPGYARNYLIPQGLAYMASESNMRRLEEERVFLEEKAKRDFLEAKRRASQLEGVSVTFKVNAGEDGKLFGSVTTKDIADQVNEGDIDFELDRRAIVLAEPIKLLGVQEVPIRLHPEVDVGIEVRVERDEE